MSIWIRLRLPAGGRIGEEGVEWLLTQTIRAGQESGVIDEDSAKRVAVDTTVMEKNIAYPTDARLYERAREQLVELAQEAGVELRQSHARLAPRLALQAVATPMPSSSSACALKKLKGHTGRVMRDLRRHLDDITDTALRERVIAKLALVSRLRHQQPKGSNKIYALHEPEVDCISKGKARARCEFGCKVSVATTLDEGFVVGMRSFPGAPYDGHTLSSALEQVTILTDQRPELAVAGRGYRGHGEEKTRALISGMRRGLTPELIADLRRRSMLRCPTRGAGSYRRALRHRARNLRSLRRYPTCCPQETQHPEGYSLLRLGRAAAYADPRQRRSGQGLSLWA